MEDPYEKGAQALFEFDAAHQGKRKLWMTAPTATQQLYRDRCEAVMRAMSYCEDGPKPKYVPIILAMGSHRCVPIDAAHETKLKASGWKDQNERVFSHYEPVSTAEGGSYVGVAVFTNGDRDPHYNHDWGRQSVSANSAPEKGHAHAVHDQLVTILKDAEESENK